MLFLIIETAPKNKSEITLKNSGSYKLKVYICSVRSEKQCSCQSKTGLMCFSEMLF